MPKPSRVEGVARRGAPTSPPSSFTADFYSCADKADGNYIHPTDCTKFISCVAQQ
ncbi:chitin binding peritrophin-A domain-containing protein [Streptomyces sp. LN699]|uniref:chitin binding peritrophin-A domain-containing protein n=1 Tax=Streptomyces sp. LN699 TaxID=3112981 RepID=UPI003724154E